MMERTGIINLCILLREDQDLVNQLNRFIKEGDIWVPCRVFNEMPYARIELYPGAIHVLSKITSKFNGGRINIMMSYNCHIPGFAELDSRSQGRYDMDYCIKFWDDLALNDGPSSYFRRDEDRIRAQMMQGELLKQQQMASSNIGNPMYQSYIHNNYGMHTVIPFNMQMNSPTVQLREVPESKDLDLPMLVKADKEVKPFKFVINE